MSEVKPYEVSPVYEAIADSPAKVVVLQGGTRSTKTYSALQYLITKAISEPGIIVTVVGQDVPNLKKGAIRDVKKIVDSNPRFSFAASAHKEQAKEQHFKNGSIIEFSSFKDEQDAKSGARDYLFINEAQGIRYEIFRQLYIRTRKESIIDYNPDRKFWVHFKIINSDIYKSELIISDHRQNNWIPQEMHDDIESMKEEDLELWKVYARGKTGKLKGLIFQNFADYPPGRGEEFNKHGIPIGAKFIGYGMDFGFTNDPTALIGAWLEGKNLYLKQFIYETGLTTPQINELMEEIGINKRDEIEADSADPRLIRELQDFGWNIARVNKEQILGGIDVLKRFKILIVESSDLLKEFNSYLWKKDRVTGKTLNIPIDKFNHGIDATRYGIVNKIIVPTIKEKYSDQWD